MTGVGIQTLLPFFGIRSAMVSYEIMEFLAFLHVLGNSYRLATSGVRLGSIYGRFTWGFCRTVAGAVGNFASDRTSSCATRLYQSVGRTLSSRTSLTALKQERYERLLHSFQ